MKLGVLEDWRDAAAVFILIGVIAVVAPIYGFWCLLRRSR